MNIADDLEHQLGLAICWTPLDAEYKKAVGYIQHWEFICAAEELECLVVQRLLELLKAHLMETGYKMQKHIGEAITCHSVAVQAAVERYNALTPLQTPPCPTLEYFVIVAYSGLGEFDLFKESWHEVLDQPWAILAHCEMATKYYKIIQACEELLWLNIESHHLYTW
ncbi:hypothetical protein K439DRAFT_1370802 [Ramaria rubella]|nr:hypothetical protein K439DRAFT_1370802 [Ramaria rubella]